MERLCAYVGKFSAKIATEGAGAEGPRNQWVRCGAGLMWGESGLTRPWDERGLRRNRGGWVPDSRQCAPNRQIGISMLRMKLLTLVAALILSAAVCATSSSADYFVVSAQDQKSVPKLHIDRDSAVRFLFRRSNSNYVLPALIFRVADVGSPRWNTAPIDRYGRSAFISLSEMRALVRELNGVGISPQVSSAIESIEPFEEMPISENVVVSIYSSDGTATWKIPPREICKDLARLNNLVEGQRPHWEFEYFRLGCGCKVPGHKYDAYPNDR